VTVHEFGHSFVGVLDEYTGNPEPPRGRIMAPNASTVDDPEKVPWAHFIKQRVKGVGVFEGGATYSKGVWRPSRSCAMNVAGNSGYCPVCRETAVLRIYSYVDPIDRSSPDHEHPVTVETRSKDVLEVVPMAPSTHQLDVSWFVEALGADSPPHEEEPEDTRARDGYARPRERGEWWFRMSGGRRGRTDRTAHDQPPRGERSRLGRASGSRPRVHTFPAGRMDPGRYRITAVVKDPVPWVIADPHHLLEERRTWQVTVNPRPAPSAAR
jgi:hypothetical protein